MRACVRIGRAHDLFEVCKCLCVCVCARASVCLRGRGIPPTCVDRVVESSRVVSMVSSSSSERLVTLSSASLPMSKASTWSSDAGPPGGWLLVFVGKLKVVSMFSIVT